MPYSKSASRKYFESQSEMNVSQVRIASLKKSKINPQLIQCIFNNAIFQVSAAFEDYLKSVFEDWVDLLVRNDSNITLAPKELLSFASGRSQLSAYASYIISRDENDFISKLCGNSKTKLFHSDESLIKHLIRPSEFVQDRKYPSEKNIKVLFYRFGINNIFDKMNSVGKKNYKNQLKSFSDSRTSIAHTSITQTLSKDDVIEKIRIVQDIVRVMDRILYSHVIKNSGVSFWNTQLLPV